MDANRVNMGIALGLALLFIGVASTRLGPLNKQREELQLTFNPEALKNMPPEIALLQTALGSVRGLAVDYFWIRFQRLQENGQYYEAMRLGRWITKLQRNIPQVWSHQSWNLSFNLSTYVRTNPERWMWVDAGIRLLRDEGIPLNPGATDLYKQLAHTFLYKIGKISIQEHWYFKQRLAEEWQDVLGPPNEGTPQEVVAAFRSILNAPGDLEELRRNNPAAAQAAAEIKALGYNLDARFVKALSHWEFHFPLEGPGTDEAEGRPEQEAREREKNSPEAKLRAWFDQPAHEAVRVALAGYARRKLLSETYHMDPMLMHEMLEKFGPIDWRHPMAHSCYWGYQGSKIANTRFGKDSFEVTQLHRYVLQSVQHLGFSGRVYYDRETGYYNQSPDPRLFRSYDNALLDAAKSRELMPGETPFELKDGHRGFLMWAVQKAYLFGKKEIAAEFYQKLREQYGTEYPGEYELPLTEFVRKQIVKNIDLWENVTSNISALTMQALLEGMVVNRPEVAQRSLSMARFLYNSFRKKESLSGADKRRMEEMPPFEDIVADTFGRFLLLPTAQVNAVIKDPALLKIRAWSRSPYWLRQRIYPRIKSKLEEMARAEKLDPSEAFPAPASVPPHGRIYDEVPTGEESDLNTNANMH